MKIVDNYRIFKKIIRKFNNRHCVKHVDYFNGRRFVSYWEKEDWLGYRVDSLDKLTPQVMKYIHFMIGEEMMDEFDIDFFARLVGYYCHVRSIDDPEVERMMADDYGLDRERINDSITVFYKGSAPKISYKSDISDTTFEVIKLERKKYWNENGCRAFRRKLVSEIREDNARQAEKNRDNSVC